MKTIRVRFPTFWVLPAVSFSISTGWADPPTSGSASFSLLPGELGAAGGRAASATYSAETSTAGAIAGGSSNVTANGVQARGGYTGQLYDPASLAVSADPDTTLDEGSAVQLSAQVAMDDGSTLEGAEGANWSIVSGPIFHLDISGLAVAGPVMATTPARVRGEFGGLSGDLDLIVNDLPYEASPIVWNDPGGNGPYQIFFGTNPAALPLVGNSPLPFFDPGQLAMGTTFHYQVKDSLDNDLTGILNFTTSLYRPDIRIGSKGNPGTHKGNNVYNLSGAGQFAKLTLKGKRKGKLHFSVENDGDSRDAHRIRGQRANRKFKSIEYFRLSGGRVNVTAAIIGGGHLQPDVNPGNVVTYQIQAKAKGKKRAGQTLRVGSTSTGDIRGADLSKGKLKGLVKK